MGTSARNFQTKGKILTCSPYYNYKPLPSGWIRLLQIHDAEHGAAAAPKQGPDFSAAIYVSLTDYPLSSCPKFTALSYTWGSPTRDVDPKYVAFTTVPRCFPITCNGKLLRGTRNLRDALRRIRETQSARKRLESRGVDIRDPRLIPSAWEFMDWYVEGDYLWIDALCIDQDDLHERACQVTMMGQIYTMANACLVWLGDFDEPAIKVMHRIYTQFSAHPRRRPATLSSHKVRAKAIITSLGQGDALAVCRLLSLTWFSRLWVLQEVILAEKSVAMCGSQLSSFEVICQVGYIVAQYDGTMQLISHLADHPDGRELTEYVQQSCLVLDSIIQARRLKRFPNRTSFVNVLASSMRSNATDDKDKIYGMMSVAALIETHPSARLDIVVDYTLPTERVYTAATISLARLCRSLEILGIARGVSDRKHRQLPSWCPDYSMGCAIGGAGTDLDDTFLASRKWCASSPVIESSPDNLTLTVEGFRYDTVCSTLFLPKSPSEVNMLDAFAFIAELFAFAATLKPRDNSRVESLRKLLMTGVFAGEDDGHQARAAGLLFPSVVLGMLLSIAPNASHDGPASRPGVLLSIAQSLESLEDSVRTLIRLEPQSILFLPDPGTLMRAREALLAEDDTSSEPIGQVLVSMIHVDFLERVNRASLCEEVASLLAMESWDSDASRTALSYACQISIDVAINSSGPLFFTTSRSQLFGYGHNNNIDKDCELWVLHGLKSPVVLRRKGECRYEFCGTTVVKGAFLEEFAGDISRITLE